MGFHEQESFQAKLKSAKEELIKGQKLATRLQVLLEEKLPLENYSGPAATGLLIEVKCSFSKVLSLLDLEEVPEAPLGDANSPCSDEQRGEISRIKKKIQPPRKSGYRRRAHPYTCRTVLRKEIEDGYTWRKYGQKIIHGATNQRSYYRCTHKHDRDCQATRQVQKTEGNTLYAITYMGEHTCTDAKLPNQRTPCVISFESNTTANDHQQETPSPRPPSTVVTSIKQEFDEEVISNHSPRSASSELPVLGDLSDFAGSAPMAHFMRSAFDQYDVTSGFCSSPSSLDIGFDAETFELDDIFNFCQD
ncbi:hypothetical protein Cni_G05429 [Canna indica]|uniref:WRKY domain-containing protein n=1 Tax=Canna indica TaxID=4628 RepID=A0AAQ3JX67_9LILI|nr:hypothetical protein Cni_G05429 [Canna indica]